MSVGDSYEVFQCPKCQQYISNKLDACRFCFFLLNDEIKTQAINGETENTRKYRIKMHKGVLYSGLGIFALGLSLSAVSIISIFYVGQGYYFPWSPVVVLFGLGQMLIGVWGIRDERKK